MLNSNNKQYKFFFHYNKPASTAKGKPVITVHYRNQCIPVSNVIVDVKTKGEIRKQQPRFVVAGKATKVDVINDVAYIS